MTMFNNRYKVEPNRLQYWDYSANGYYFITICVDNRESILGEIKNSEMILSAYGEIVRNEIIKMNDYHVRANIHEWVVMPNHIHLLIELMDGDDGHVKKIHSGKIHVKKIHEFSLQQRPPQSRPPWLHDLNYKPTIDEIKQYRKQRRRMIIPKMVGKLQMQTSKQINIKRNTPGVQNWQSSYHDHIIRDAKSYQRIKDYIVNNPKNWEEDILK